MSDGIDYTECLMAIAKSLQGVARAIDRLGTADAATPMGAIEVLSKEMNEGFSILADAVIHAADSRE